MTSQGAIGVADLFPSIVDGGGPDELQKDMLVLSQDIGVPFPVEPNPQYANWWRSLHEIAHWAVKPDWYINTQGAQQIDTFTGYPDEGLRVCIPKLTGEVLFYNAGNDIIPNLGMLEGTDPTPSEPEVRIWSLAVMARHGLVHPFRRILVDQVPPQEVERLGDDGWHKAATAQVWAPTSMLVPEAVSRMARFGLNPLVGAYRPAETGYSPPHSTVDRPSQLRENFASIIAEHASPASPADFDVQNVQQLQVRYWDTYSMWKRFFNERTAGVEYDALLEEFDQTYHGCFDAFKTAWSKEAHMYGHVALAELTEFDSNL